MQSRPRAVYLSPSRPLSCCSMCHEQLSLSHRSSLRVQLLTSVVMGKMLRRSETYPRHFDSSRLVLDRGMINCWQATSWRTRSHCCPYSTGELTANFFWTAAAVAVDRLSGSMNQMMLQFSFVILRASFHAHGTAGCHNNTHAYFVSRWEKEAERARLLSNNSHREFWTEILNSACYVLS